MKIALIGPGVLPIPPNGWGAVESIVWDYYCNLKNTDHDVIIINEKDHKTIVQKINQSNIDIVHIMYDNHINIVPFLHSKNIVYTSHYAYITSPHFTTTYRSYFKGIFMNVIRHRHRIKMINVISSKIKDIYVKYGFPAHKITILHNGAREDLFKYFKEPKFPEKSIYLAKVEERKRQYVYQSIDNIDFVGNYHNSSFSKTNKNYLGHWSKDVLYSNLSNYGNLILLSDGEADPLVTKEALLCGLGLVISECASENVDTTLPFITVIKNNKLNDLEFVKTEIEKNRIISVGMRDEIRQYGLSHFSWNAIVDKYINILKIIL